MQTQETCHFSSDDSLGRDLREEKSDGKARISSLKAEHMELEQLKHK